MGEPVSDTRRWRTADVLGPALIATTILLTVYGQLIVKWQVGEAGDFPASTADRIHFLARLVANPWIISVFVAAAIAALSWMAAMTRYDLSVAYPFVALSFVLVLIGSAVFFDESLNAAKVAGIALIVVGIVIGSRGA
jgi:multidrug transporter EmrE-like cation transporter